MPDQFTIARRRLDALILTLEPVVAQDSEQEVHGMAVPVLDAVLVEARDLLLDEPVAQAARDAISVEAVESGDSTRAVDALLVARQLKAAMGREPATVVRKRTDSFPPTRRPSF
jgi:hypothetical protein